MARKPSYVRLREGVTYRGDIGGSAWFISGLSVKKYPEDAEAQAFVDAEIQKGTLEPASKAEFDEAQEGDAERPEKAKNVHQEGDIQAAAAEARAKVQEARAKARSKAKKGDDEDEPESPVDEEGPLNLEEQG